MRRKLIHTITQQDVGKRIYSVGGIYQVENDEQRDKRLGILPSPTPCDRSGYMFVVVKRPGDRKFTAFVSMEVWDASSKEHMVEANGPHTYEFVKQMRAKHRGISLMERGQF